MKSDVWSVFLGLALGCAAVQGAESLSQEDGVALRKAYNTVDRLAASPNAFELQDIRQRKESASIDVAYIQGQMRWLAARGKKADAKKLEAALGKARQALTSLTKQEASLASGTDGALATAELVVPGDVLEVYVTEDASFNGIYQVRRGGYIVIPQLGRVQVAGYPVTAAEAVVKGSLDVSYLNNATVLVERRSSQTSLAAAVEEGVLLDGEFVSRRPGVAKLEGVGGGSLVSTILREGGTSPFADMEHVRVLRLIDGKPLLETINVDAILAGDELASDLDLQDDDIVIIPTRVGKTDEVYVTGKVASPGILPLRKEEEITVYTAVLRVGGFDRFANLKKAYVLRDEGDGVKVRMGVNLKNVEKGKGADLVLQSGDIVVVPEKFFSF